MQWHHERTKACIGNHLGLRVVELQSGVLRVDLRLSLRESGVRFEPGNHLYDISPSMPPRWQPIFRARGKREEQTGIGREKAEGGRQDADHGPGNSVYTNLLSDHIGIGIESLSPK